MSTFKLLTVCFRYRCKERQWNSHIWGAWSYLFSSAIGLTRWQAIVWCNAQKYEKYYSKYVGRWYSEESHIGESRPLIYFNYVMNSIFLLQKRIIILQTVLTSYKFIFLCDYNHLSPFIFPGPIDKNHIWFRQWHCAKQAANHDLHKWWPALQTYERHSNLVI